MSTLSSFFAQNAIHLDTELFVVSKRFVDADGKPVPWKLRSMTEAENEECRRAATKQVKGKGNARQTELNGDEYLLKLVAKSVVFPELGDADLQKSYGVLGAENLLRKMLLPGEYANLLVKAQEINGFESDINELVDEVKN